MQELKIINEQEVLGKQFRVYGTIEKPLFLAKDVAEWIEHSNSRMMLQSIDESEKECVNNPYALQGQKEQWFLTENGLYEVLMQSRKPIAKAFKEQVKKILHSIRVNGGYIANQENLSDDEIVANALVVANRIIERKNQLIEEMKPKVEFFDTVADSSSLLSMQEVASVINRKGIGRNNLFAILREKNILNLNNLPYRQYIDRDYFKVIEKPVMIKGETTVKTVTMVTQKGVDYIIKQLGGEKWLKEECLQRQAID